MQITHLQNPQVFILHLSNEPDEQAVLDWFETYDEEALNYDLYFGSGDQIAIIFYDETLATLFKITWL